MTWFGGWATPWPLEWGGGPGIVEKLYAAMRSVVGLGHAADADGVDRRWRQARTIGLAVGAASIEQAFFQFDPDTARSGMAYYRELFQIPDGTPEEEARELASFLFHDRGSVDVPTVLERLRTIDPRFQATLVPDVTCSSTLPGARAFESWSGAPPFNLWGRRETRFANHSSSFKLLVTLQVEAVGELERRSIAAARRYLDGGVGWCSYSIAIGAGFRIGRSPLGRVRLAV